MIVVMFSYIELSLDSIRSIGVHDCACIVFTINTESIDIKMQKTFVKISIQHVLAKPG